VFSGFLSGLLGLGGTPGRYVPPHMKRLGGINKPQRLK
jgi:hypothetical protein